MAFHSSNPDAFSMQTGNTIFLSLGASGQNNKPYGWARSLVSIACFVIGSFVFSRLHAFLNPRRRGTLVLSFALQSAFVVLASAMVQVSLRPSPPSHGHGPWQEPG